MKVYDMVPDHGDVISEYDPTEFNEELGHHCGAYCQHTGQAFGNFFRQSYIKGDYAEQRHGSTLCSISVCVCVCVCVVKMDTFMLWTQRLQPNRIFGQ